MRMIDLIEKKRDKKQLSKEELSFIIDNYIKGTIPDYQVSALLMAIYFNGMSTEEIYDLTIIMRDSGDVLDLSMINGIKVDKHSTGGVGDKTTLVVAPLVASLGVKFAKMSGKGLGHTGGTLDKLESIPGFKIDISPEDFIKQVNEIGIALVGQSGNLTPADKKLYALRDVTGTVSSVPLIASSVMSKKLASGADAICLDVKVGSGAFMKDLARSEKLAKLMVEIGKKNGKMMTAILSNMDEPLGFAVGNSLEYIEAIDTLTGKGPSDLLELCLCISTCLIIDAKIAKTEEEARILLLSSIKSGKAIVKLAEMVKAQGGDREYIYNTKKFDIAPNQIPIYATCDGYITRIDALAVGHAARLLGAGRTKLGDKVDLSVGIVLNKKVGYIVNKGDLLATIYANEVGIEEAKMILNEAFVISREKKEQQLIYSVIR